MSANGVALLYKNGVMEFRDFGRMGVRLESLEVKDNIETILAALFMVNAGRNGGLQRIVPIKIDFMPSFGERATGPLMQEFRRVLDEEVARTTDPAELKVLKAEHAFLNPAGGTSRRDMYRSLAAAFRGRAEQDRREGRSQSAVDLEALAAAAELEGGPADPRTVPEPDTVSDESEPEGQP